MNARGLVAYHGPSRLDGAPIVLIVTFASLNTKTGSMAQAWVLRADVSPQEAIADGRDRSICGDCVHRSGGAVGRSCYVITWLGPLQVYKQFRANQYPTMTPALAAPYLAGEQLRMAAYGDPAAVPLEVWRTLLIHTSGWTGYTHQWRSCDQRFSAFLMASVESEHEVDQAQALGWRTFRTRLATEPVRADEIICPASNEAGHLTTCESCNLCTGRARGSARSVVIQAHGQRTAVFASRKAAFV
jgi:hypothetical protein